MIWKRMIIILLCLNVSLTAMPVSGMTVCRAKAIKKATFAFLDVGQGNAGLIKVGSNSVLIDTGRAGEYDTLKKQLDKLNVSVVNTLIVSHPDSDHMESADRIISEYKVKRIIMPQIKSDTRCYQRMMDAVKKRKVKVLNPETGQQIELAAGCRAKVLSVDAGDNDKNEASIVMRVTYGDRSFLYMGDATARVESGILESGENIASDVYLMSHHGSDTANGVLFVKSVLSSKYKNAVISVGADNSYGHPDKFVLGRVQKYAAKVYRTDKNGGIVYKTDGNTLKVSFIKVKHSKTDSYVPSRTYTSPRKDYSSKSRDGKDNNSTDNSSTADDKVYVYVTKTGKKYHKDGCRYLNASKIKIRLGEAKGRGMTACSVCY